MPLWENSDVDEDGSLPWENAQPKIMLIDEWAFWQELSIS